MKSTDPRLIHGHDAVRFIVIDEVAHTPDEVRRALKRPPPTPEAQRTARLIAAADALQAAAKALPDCVLTYDLRAALALYRIARKGIKEE